MRRQIELLEQACEQVGRDPNSVGRLALSGVSLDPGLDSPDAFDETLGRYSEAGITDFVVHWPRREPPFAGDISTFEQICSRLTP